MGGEASQPSGAEAILAAIQAELAHEEARKESLERRGLSVITSAGTMVAVLFALVALVTARKGYDPPSVTLEFLLVALILFGLAGVLGLMANTTKNYQRARASDLREMAEEDPAILTRERALLLLIRTDAKVLSDAQTKTNAKAAFVTWGLRLEVLAIVVAAVAVGAVLVREL